MRARERREAVVEKVVPKLPVHAPSAVWAAVRVLMLAAFHARQTLGEVWKLACAA